MTAELAAPFIPETAGRIAELLNLSDRSLALPGPTWGTTFGQGHVVQKPVPLFPRIGD